MRTGRTLYTASLADIEITRCSAVKDAGLIVEVTDHLLGLICYPPLTDAYLRNFRTLYDASDAERNNNRRRTSWQASSALVSFGAPGAFIDPSIND